jgi:hypothetical protein
MEPAEASRLSGAHLEKSFRHPACKTWQFALVVVRNPKVYSIAMGRFSLLPLLFLSSMAQDGRFLAVKEKNNRGNI